MSKDFNIKLGNSYNADSITQTDLKAGIKKEEFKDNQSRSIFEKLDINEDGELNQNEIDIIKNSLESVAASDGNVSSLSKDEAKVLITKLGLGNIKAKTLFSFFSKIKELSSKITSNPLNDIKKRYGQENSNIFKRNEDLYFVQPDKNSSDRFVCNGDGRKLEEWKDGKMLYSYQPYEPDPYNAYKSTENTNDIVGKYRNQKGEALANVMGNGDLYCYPNENETLIDAIKRFGITNPEDIQTIIEANSDRPINQPLFNKETGECLYINIPNDIANKIEISNFLNKLPEDAF